MAASLKRLSKPALLLIVPLVLMSPLLLTGKVMFWGTVSLQFLPWSVLAARVMQAGQLPLWNPLVGMGAPLLANYQSALLYPPNWLVLLAAGMWGAGWAATMQTWLVAFHLAWAGVGMYFLAQRIGIHTLGRVVCGLSFALSGYLVARSAFISINATVAWTPWLILCVTWLAGGKTTLIKVVTTGVVAGMLLLAGHAQTAWYAILFAFAWITCMTWLDAEEQIARDKDAQGSPLRFKARLISLKWLALFLAMGLGACLAAAQLIPTAELLLQSQRAKAVDFDFAMTYSFWPWRFLTLLAPGLFGSPVSGDYWGYGNYWEDALYIGVLPFLSAVAMLISVLAGRSHSKQNASPRAAENPRRRQAVLAIFLLMISVVAFILALGKNTPVYPWLYFHIPSFAVFQAPTRISIWAVLSLCLLAGMGIDCLERPTGRLLYWTRLGTAGAGAVTLGVGLAWYFLGGISPTFINSTAIFGFFAMCAGLLALTAPEAGGSGDPASMKGKLWQWALLLVLGLDLLIASWNLNPGIEKGFYSPDAQPPVSVNTAPAMGRLYLNPEDEYELKFKRFMRFDSYQNEAGWDTLRKVELPNINILDNIPTANNFDPLVPARYARWIDALGKMEAGGDDRLIYRLLNLMGVNRVVYLKDDDPAGVVFQKLENSQQVRWVGCAIPARDGEEAWKFVFSENSDFEREVIIENADGAPDTPCNHASTPVDVKVVDRVPNRITMSVNSLQAGWLVVSDVWYPGWQAEIDGKPTPIFRANYLFRAVNVPPGGHTVTFTYSPGSFWTGLVIITVAWVFVGMSYALILKRRWTRP